MSICVGAHLWFFFFSFFVGMWLYYNKASQVHLIILICKLKYEEMPDPALQVDIAHYTQFFFLLA